MAAKHLIREGLRALIGAMLAYALVAQLLLGATASARQTAELAAGSAGLALCVTHGASDTPADRPTRHDEGSTCCDWGCCPGGAALPGPVPSVTPLSSHSLLADVFALSEIIVDRETSGRPQQPRAPPLA